jgi:hypothetical protein
MSGDAGRPFISVEQVGRVCSIAVFVGCAAAACTSQEFRPTQLLHPQAVVDGRCSDLAGVYNEQGTTIRAQGSSPDAHLSWLISGEKRRSADARLNSAPGPGLPAFYYVKTMRLSHPAPGRFSLEAFDAEGRSVGAFDFGPEEGWQCGEDSFFVYREEQGGGEGTWGERISLHRLYRGADGVLVRSVQERYQQRSIFTLGLPVGQPKIVEVEYRFSPTAR